MIFSSNIKQAKNPKTKPILKWAGGKSALIKQLSTFLPTSFSNYFEPFFGGGAVFFSLNYFGISYLNDSNKELINLYEIVRDYPKELMIALDNLSIYYSEDFYYQLRKTNPLNEIDRAARTIFLNKTGFNGLYRQNLKGEFNVPFGKRINCPALYSKENLLLVSNALKNASLSSSDFEDKINMAEKGSLVYCDPPYEPLSSTSSFNSYQKGGFSQADQIRLKEACLKAQKRGAHIIISNSSAEFIKNLYSDCQVHFISAKRSINSKGNMRGEINELVIVMPSC